MRPRHRAQALRTRAVDDSPLAPVRKDEGEEGPALLRIERGRLLYVVRRDDEEEEWSAPKVWAFCKSVKIRMMKVVDVCG